ncbi:MAG: HEAT repeat domain-containing protein [Zavarzinella sp.]|nr:HEAT repeat domain-containing protein [Zavarzinella sp.]
MAVSRKLLARLQRPAEAARDLPALRGIDDVDWASLEHAHGKATDVPVLLRAAACDDPDARDLAFELLYETIWHQGDVYPATAPVVPFLYRLLEADETPDKPQVAHLLATLAGCSFAHMPDPTGAYADPAATRRAVGKQLDLLIPYLRDRDWGVRQAVAWAIGRFPEVAVRLLPALEAAYRKERNQAVRLGLAWAIGQSPEGAARVLPDLEAAVRDAPDPWSRQAFQGVIDALAQRRT